MSLQLLLEVLVRLDYGDGVFVSLCEVSLSGQQGRLVGLQLLLSLKKLCLRVCKLGACIMYFSSMKGESSSHLSEGRLLLLLFVTDYSSIDAGGVKVGLESFDVALLGFRLFLMECDLLC